MSRTQREPPPSQPIIDSDLGRADSLEVDAPIQLKQGRFRSHGAALFLLCADLSAVAITVAIFVPDADLWIGLVFSVLVMLGFAQVGLYRSRLTLSILDDLPTISGRVLVAAGIAWILVAMDSTWTRIRGCSRSTFRFFLPRARWLMRGSTSFAAAGS